MVPDPVMTPQPLPPRKRGVSVHSPVARSNWILYVALGLWLLPTNRSPTIATLKPDSLLSRVPSREFPRMTWQATFIESPRGSRLLIAGAVARIAGYLHGGFQHSYKEKRRQDAAQQGPENVHMNKSPDMIRKRRIAPPHQPSH